MFSDTEDRLLNFILAVTCCLVFIGGMWLVGVVP